MINLFHIPHHQIDTGQFSNLLHDPIVSEFEEVFAEYVGAKYACSLNSATSAIFLIFNQKNVTVKAPSIIPPVVLNAILTGQNKIKFIDNIEWVGDSYVLHHFDTYKVIDSAQKVDRNQFQLEANPNDLMVFSFYPTKPVGGSDGGMIVSDDREKIEWFRTAVMNGTSFDTDNWKREIHFPGWKMYMNSIQAQIALVSLKALDKKKEQLRSVRERYNASLGYANTSDHLYRIRAQDNDRAIQYMKEADIVCGIHYKAMHLHPVYTTNDANCPRSTRESQMALSIPFHEMLSVKDIDLILRMISDYE